MYKVKFTDRFFALDKCKEVALKTMNYLLFLYEEAQDKGIINDFDALMDTISGSYYISIIPEANDKVIKSELISCMYPIGIQFRPEVYEMPKKSVFLGVYIDFGYGENKTFTISLFDGEDIDRVFLQVKKEIDNVLNIL